MSLLMSRNLANFDLSNLCSCSGYLIFYFFTSIDWFFCGSETARSFELGPAVILCCEGAHSPTWRELKTSKPLVKYHLEGGRAGELLPSNMMYAQDCQQTDVSVSWVFTMITEITRIGHWLSVELEGIRSYKSY